MIHKGKVRYWPILGLTAITRILSAWFAIHSHPVSWFFAQASELGCLARSLQSGGGLSSPFGGSTGPSAFLAPGYPSFVALLFAILGSYTRAAEIAQIGLQIVFAILTVWMTMKVANQILGPREANLAGAVWAINPIAWWLPVLFWDTSLSILFVTGSILLASRTAQDPSSSRWLFNGVYCGAAILVNPSLLLVLGGVMIWTLWQARPFSLRKPLVGLTAFLIIFLPWPIRNYRTMHQPILLRDNLGYELWQGNGPDANGFFRASLHPNANQQEFARFAELGELGYMHEKSVLAKQAIKSDPGRFARLTVKRIAYFWAGMDQRPPSLLIVSYMVGGGLAAVFGLVALWKERSRYGLLLTIPLLVFPLPYYLTHPDFRFRLVIDPIIVVLACHAIVQRSARSTGEAKTSKLPVRNVTD